MVRCVGREAGASNHEAVAVAFIFDRIYRAPKIAEPTRTLVAPKATAIS